MRAIDAIHNALAWGDRDIRFIEDMRSAPVAQPTPQCGAHALWILGHFAIAEGRLRQIVLGEPHPVEHWKPLFDWGSEPVADVNAYPPFDDVLETYRQLRARNRQLLEEIGEAGLDRPTKNPPQGLEDGFKTIGQAFLTIALHQVFHGGQASIVRRASGRAPFFVPSEALRRS
jgi:hypothetical protein